MELISIVVPIYNTEKYISRCVTSLIKQTYRNIEIILVDDGSQDNSAKICDRFAKKDGRIKVIHKQNSGVSETRNVGIDAASGEYLLFVDGDDFLPLDAVEILYNTIKFDNADMSCGCWAKITVKGTTYNHHSSKTVSVDDKEQLMKIMDYEEIKGPVAKLFKTEVIKSHGFTFPEDIKISEDTIFVYKYLRECKTISIVDRNVYYYNRLSVGSATTKYYDRFNLSSFMCIDEYVNNIVSSEADWLNLRLQQKIVNQFNAVNQYVIFYKSNDRQEAVQKLIETYNLFKGAIKNQVVFENKELFEAYISFYPYFQDGNFEGLFDFLKSYYPSVNIRNKKSAKNLVIDLISRIKTMILFTLKIGFTK